MPYSGAVFPGAGLIVLGKSDARSVADVKTLALVYQVPHQTLSIGHQTPPSSQSKVGKFKVKMFSAGKSPSLYS